MLGSVFSAWRTIDTISARWSGVKPLATGVEAGASARATAAASADASTSAATIP